MPKLRSKKPKRIQRKSKHKPIGIYLLVGFFTCLVIWLIVKEPTPISKDNSNDSVEHESVNKEKRSSSLKQKHNKKKDSTKDKEIRDKADLSHDAASKPSAPEIKTIETAIHETIDKLGIPKGYTKRKKSDNLITFSVPIDKSVMDLTYANMIFKGEIERAGGYFVKGTDSSGRQSLMFGTKQNTDRYVINLFYDSKLYAGKSNPKTISIVIDDFGAISGELLNAFLSLDKEVSFAIFPDEPYSVLTMEKAAAQGRETLIHVPMEPIGYPNVNPGKNAIFVQYSSSEIDKIITRFIKQLPDCGGINNHMGSLATTDEDVMRAVMTSLKKHNKFFLDSRTSNVSVAYSVAQKTHIQSYRNDIFLDSPNISQSTMDAKLSQIVELSATRSNIVAITHCHNMEKYHYLKRFITKLKAAGFTLVPLSKTGQYNVPGLL